MRQFILDYFILGSSKLGRADFMASEPHGPPILGMDELAGEPTYSIFSIGHFRNIIGHTVVLGADCLGSSDCIFLLHGMCSECFNKPR